ncbi:aldo/keto reductase [Streptomyces sp. NPDC001404]|uniref:aldo/keto reductase n=1 Tax=Streptomyces sp. NPDC001404 TaxID=3364571 RepID=UPI0036D0C5DA
MAAASLPARRLCRQTAVHPLGVHCAAVGDRPGPRDELLRRGLWSAAEHGATLLDTSDSYGLGHSERVIGQFLHEWTGHRLQVSSKTGLVRGTAPHPYAGRHIHHQFEQTIENLYLEPPLDLYTLASLDFGPGDRYLYSAIEQMRILRRNGDITAIGMRGPHAALGAPLEEWHRQAARFVSLFRAIQPDVVWTHFHGLTPAVPLTDEGEDLFTFTRRHGVGLVLAAPLAHGVLVGRPFGPRGGGARSFDPVATGLKELRGRFGDAPGTLNRLALRLCLQKADHAVVIVGCSDQGQAEENFGCLGDPLTDDELEAGESAYARIRAGLQDADAPPVQEAVV